jgi:phage terminase large subunit-like protein
MEIKNIEQLTDELQKIFCEVREKKIGKQEAEVLANVAGKIISSAKTKLDYNKFVGAKRPINFMEDGE